MTIGLLKEPSGENRVALLPESVKAFIDLKTEVLTETGAGDNSYASDKSYTDIGAKVVSRAEALKCEVVVGINQPTDAEIDGMSANQVLVCVFQPLSNKALVEKFMAKNLTTFSLDNVPRTTRAQSMDILSSMATATGYKAVLLAATHSPRFFPMLMTAAGSIIPSKTMVLGAGVAGLQAIATAKRLGSVVEAFDVRTAAEEEVLSLGAKFIKVEGAKDEASAGGYAVEQSEDYKAKQRALVHEHASKANIIITTAQIPGRTAPILITKATVEAMLPGSVIVDLASSSGGNCELTEDNKIVKKHGVTIIGDSNLSSTLSMDASKMFGKNVFNFLKLMIDEEGGLNLNFEDDIVLNTCVTNNKEVVSERVKNILFPSVNS